jgi:hypothetical protein
MDVSTRNLKKLIRDLGELGVQTLNFAGALGSRREASNRLLVVGTPEFEPWHFVAHLSEEADRDFDVTQHIVTDVAPTGEPQSRPRWPWGPSRPRL